jgi:hypothetical protein
MSSGPIPCISCYLQGSGSCLAWVSSHHFDWTQHTKRVILHEHFFGVTIFTNMSYSCRNAIGSHVILDSDSLPMKIYINLFLLSLLVINFLNINICYLYCQFFNTKWTGRQFLLTYICEYMNQWNCNNTKHFSMLKCYYMNLPFNNCKHDTVFRKCHWKSFYSG